MSCSPVSVQVFVDVFGFSDVKICGLRTQGDSVSVSGRLVLIVYQFVSEGDVGFEGDSSEQNDVLNLYLDKSEE